MAGLQAAGRAPVSVEAHHGVSVPMSGLATVQRTSTRERKPGRGPSGAALLGRACPPLLPPTKRALGTSLLTRHLPGRWHRAVWRVGWKEEATPSPGHGAGRHRGPHSCPAPSCLRRKHQLPVPGQRERKPSWHVGHDSESRPGEETGSLVGKAPTHRGLTC